MKTLGNIIWIITGGLVVSILWALRTFILHNHSRNTLGGSMLQIRRAFLVSLRKEVELGADLFQPLLIFSGLSAAGFRWLWLMRL